jgi:hypothetical protein
MESPPTCSCRVAYLPDPVKIDSEPGYPPPAVRALLESEPDITCETITVASLLAGCLLEREFSVLCIPGGFAPNYAQRLGLEGLALIQAFVRDGGGFVGLCAGAYLGSSACLSLLPVEVLDMHRWARGCGPCQLAFTHLASRTLGALGPASLLTVRYANGPLLQISAALPHDTETQRSEGATPTSGDASESPGVLRCAFPLAHYATEVGATVLGSSFPPIMAGSPAAVVGSYGAGLVLLASPHFEDGEDERSLTPFRNFFRFCSRDSPYQTWCLGGLPLSQLAAAVAADARVGSEGPAVPPQTCRSPQDAFVKATVSDTLVPLNVFSSHWDGRVVELGVFGETS